MVLPTQFCHHFLGNILIPCLFQNIDCQLDNLNYPGDDIRRIDNIESWQECGKEQYLFKLFLSAINLIIHLSKKNLVSVFFIPNH